MDGNEQTELGGAFHAGAQLLFVHRWKIIDAAVAHERLQSDDAAITQRFELIDVARNDSTPQSEVDKRIRFRSSAFEIETPAVDRGRLRVERHLENRGRSAGRRSARPGIESFPFGSTRLVEMNVRVDHAGKDGEVCRIDFLARGTGKIFPERDKLSFANSDILLAAAHEQIEIHSFVRAMLATSPHRNLLTPPSG